MEKIMTFEEAYQLYLQNRYDDIMPFSSEYESDFVDYLAENGCTVVDDMQIIEID